MQVAVISDIHANAVALKALAKSLDECNKVICLGDFVGYYCEVNEALDIIRNYDLIGVLGNHDYFLLHGYPDSVPNHVKWAIDYADKVISNEHREYLMSLPLVWRGKVGERRFLLAHGSPWHPLTDYLYRDQCDIKAMRQFDVDIVAFGQTHRPWLDEDDAPILINAGSVGQSRHVVASACVFMVDLDTLKISLIEKSYNPKRVIELAHSAGAKEWIFKHMSTRGR